MCLCCNGLIESMQLHWSDLLLNQTYVIQYLTEFVDVRGRGINLKEVLEAINLKSLSETKSRPSLVKCS